MGTNGKKKTSIGTEIQRIRAKYDLTQEEFGDLLGIARPNVTVMEASESKPTACWSALIAYIDEYGIELLRRR